MVRRLAAIVAVDVVGYSRLMAEDEAGTWAAWMELRSIIDPLFEAGGGRIVKSTGDGVLVESSSVIEVTRAAVEVQEAVAAFNAERPSDRKMQMRIGVNVGDVIVDETGDIYGDGVNVAARLEALADPGGICLSDAAYQQVRGRVDAEFKDLGERSVKNIPTPVRVWAISDRSHRRSPWKSVLFSNRAALIGVVIVGLAVVGVLFGLLGGPPPAVEVTTTAGPVTTASSVGAGPATLWDVIFDDEVTAGVVEGGVAYLAIADGSVRAISATSGESLWSFDAGGVAMNLTLAGDRLFFVRSGSKLVFAVDASSGSQAWTALVPFDAIQGAPLLAALGDDVAVAFGIGVALFDGDSGEVVWSEEPVTRLLATGLSADGSTLVVGDGRWIFGLDPADGAILWETGAPDLPSGATWIGAQEVEVQSGLGRSFDRRILLVTADQELVVLSADDGTIRWTRPVSGTPGSDANLVYVAGVDGQLVARDGADGSEVWENLMLTPEFPPILLAGVVAIVDGSDLVTVNPRSGTELARTALGVEPGLVLGAGDRFLIVIGDRVFALPMPP